MILGTGVNCFGDGGTDDDDDILQNIEVNNKNDMNVCGWEAKKDMQFSKI